MKKKGKYGEAKLIWFCSLSALGKEQNMIDPFQARKKTALVEAKTKKN